MVKSTYEKWVIKEDKNIADILVEIYGKDKQEFFQNIIHCPSSIITDLNKAVLVFDI